MRRVLLFNPPGALSVYSSSKIRAVVPRLPSLSLAMIAGALKEDGVKVKIVDLMLSSAEAASDITARSIRDFGPDIVGVTATTPLFYESCRISDIAKSISKDIMTIIGGPHASSLPEGSLAESSFDLSVAGEGERAIRDIVKGLPVDKIAGVYGRDIQPKGPHKTDDIPIDELPMPALELFDAKEYVCSRVIARRNPVGPIEMSRGCVFNCSFCNKSVHGRKFKIKSPARIIDELLQLKQLGYREFHVLDDQFTTDIAKAKAICEEMIRKDIAMTWNLRTGIRVDTIDEEFLRLAKRAGCYQVGIGFESGSQECLDAVGKGIKKEQAVRASRMIRDSGIEIAGFFMFGLPGETLESMRETIDFAIELDPDYAKATILVPFPGTRIYDEFESKHLIKTRDWSLYNFHNPSQIYEHPTLEWDLLNKYYDLFHKRFYFRLKYLIRHLWSSIRQGRLQLDLYYAYQTFFEKVSKRPLAEQGKIPSFPKELFEHVRCNLCGADDSYSDTLYAADTEKIPRTADELKAIYSSSGSDIFYEQLLRCKSCGLIYISPRPRPEIITGGYCQAIDENYVSQEKAREITFKRCVKIIAGLKKTGRLLDIGAASGIFVKQAQDAGYDACGIEPSQWMCDFAKRKYGVSVHPGTLQDKSFDENAFDIITIWDALEHIPDPMATLREAQRLLKPGGLLFINYPRIDDHLAKVFGRKWWFLLSIHLYYFTPKTLSTYLEKTGFEQLGHRPHLQLLEYDYLVKRLGVYSAFLARMAKIFYIIPGFKSLMVPYFASQYLLIARKKL